MTDPFEPIAGKGNRPSKSDGKPLRQCVTPVPPHAPAAPERHPKLGAPSAIWTYRDAAGALLGHVMRFDEKNGGKSFRPLCLFDVDGKLQWRWEAWPEPRPLYGLDRLAQHPNAKVIVCEGEKSADATQRLLPDFVCVTSPSGSKSAGKADWSALTGRSVIIWPDVDTAGLEYADKVKSLLATAGAASTAIVTPPDGVPNGWDAGDAEKEGWTTAQVLDLIGAAKVTTSSGEQNTETSGDGKRPRQRDLLLEACADSELWHDPQKVGYATIEVNGHKEHWRLDSLAFKRWFAHRYYVNTGSAPAGQMMTDALRVLEVKAINEGPCHRPFTRIGWDGEASWLDLCDKHWRAVRIAGDGWAVVDQPPVRFVRGEIMQALPTPEPGGMIEELRTFVNVDDADFILVISWLVAALWGKARSFPVLALGGEQGSGKSVLSRALRSLVDPSAVSTLSIPKDERDLFVQAMAGHVMPFDNVSRIEPWFSDAVCRLSSGAGYLTRKLHTDNEPFYFEGARPVLLNGIPALTERADLAERSLTVRLQTIGEDQRRSEDQWLTDWTTALPGILGALLDAISAVTRNYAGTHLERSPRMADFARVMAAAEPGLGWEPGAFLAAFDENRRETNEAIFESDPVAVAIRDMVLTDFPAGWEGTATELLNAINGRVTEDQRHSRYWPQKPQAMGNAVRRAAPLLRQKGIFAGDGPRRADRRTIVLKTVD